MRAFFIVLTTFITLFCAAQGVHSVVINEVLATVGNQPITLIDLKQEQSYFEKRKGLNNSGRNDPSQILDLLISRAIVDMIAEEESITVPNERIEAAIDREMQMRGFSERDAYEKKVERELGIPWSEYKQELTRQLKTQQVIQLKVTVPNPSMSQVQEWYKSNKDKLGKKIVFRMIQKTYNSSNELQVSRDMKNALAEAYRNFAAAAQKYSDHSSASRGGLVGPLRLDEVARMDPLLAGAVNNLRTGQVSQVFVGQGGYYIVKVENQQTIAIDEVYDQIRGLLMAQNEQAAFAEWIKEQKRRVAVKVFWDGYESK